MASLVIHLAIGQEINKKLKRNANKFLLGNISPDISKIIGDGKNVSHFLDEGNGEIPNLNRFLEKYKDKLNNDFILGYYAHLYVDYMWFKYFIPECNEKESVIRTIDGEEVKLDVETLSQYIYNDYTSLNEEIIDAYKIDFSLLNEKSSMISNDIEEIPCDQLWKIIEKNKIIAENSKKSKEYIFDFEMIKKFIDETVKIILEEIKILNIHS